MKTRWMLVLSAAILCSNATAFAAVLQFQEENLPNAGYTAGALDIRSGSGQADINRGFNSTGTPVPSVLIGRLATDGTDDARGLFFFDISAIPGSATINSVTLTLFGNTVDAGSANQAFTINLHQLNGTIIENGATFNTGGPSWNSRDVNGPIDWTDGGDYSSLVLSSITANPQGIVVDDPYVFNSTTAFAAAAQNALNGNGVLYLLARATSEDTAMRGLFRFRSDDSGTGVNSFGVTVQPLLTVSYTPIPEPSAIYLLSMGALGCVGYSVGRIRSRKNS